jgi:hypothetical protein
VRLDREQAAADSDRQAEQQAEGGVVNLVDYKKAAAILGYAETSGIIYEKLAGIDVHYVNGHKHWEEDQVKERAKTAGRKRKNPEAKKQSDANGGINSVVVADYLLRLDAKLDRLLSLWDVK